MGETAGGETAATAPGRMLPTPMRTPRFRGGRLSRSAPLLLAVLAPLATSAACERTPAPSAPTAWPSGTVLALNGVPIQVEDVDQVADWFATLEPQFTLPHLRRLALSNVIFPKWAARSAEPERYRAAKTAAHAALDACRKGAPPDEPALRTSKGNWVEIDLSIWRGVFDTPQGSWSDVIESPGCFHVARVDEKKSGRTPRDTTFVLAVLDFPYLDATQGVAALDGAIDRSRLEFVDETWRDYVPALWQHRLRGESP